MKKKPIDLVFPENIQLGIQTIREQKVLIDSDLVKLYGVEIKRLNEQIKRNRERFPEDFMFQLTSEEYNSLRSQFATLKRGQHRKYLPYAFTEHGAIMAASILNSPRAIEMSVFVVRAFVRLREILHSHKDLAKKISELENKLGDHDASINTIIFAIKQLMSAPPKLSKKIGFRHESQVSK
jgi:hypothetical protein